MSEINRRTYEYRIMCEFVVFEIHTKPRALRSKMKTSFFVSLAVPKKSHICMSTRDVE